MHILSVSFYGRHRGNSSATVRVMHAQHELVPGDKNWLVQSEAQRVFTRGVVGRERVETHAKAFPHLVHVSL